MTKHILLTIVLFSSATFAQSNDFGETDRKSNITPKELRERLQIDGDIVVSSPDGTKLLSQGGEMRTWKFGEKGEKIESNWNFKHRDGDVKVALRHEWTVGDDGIIRVHLQQFDSMERGDRKFKDVIYGKKLRDEVITIKDFGPVLWEVSKNDKQRVVARFNLSLQNYQEAKNPSEIPIVIEDGILTDNKSRLWTESIQGSSGKFIAITTHLGKLGLSYYPFPGASVIGTAEGNELKVRFGDLALKLRSAKPFTVGYERLKVYGRVDLNKKTDHPGSLRVSSGDKPNEAWDN